LIVSLFQLEESFMLNRDYLIGRWYHFKGTVKRVWGRALGNEVLQLEGDYDVFIGLMRKRHGHQATNQRAVS
jgi:uncharacterized protein YjbJ (UPF0337 family)